MNKDTIVFIARAIDGSWLAPNPAPTMEAAQAIIAEHEPDVAKRSAYQILAEPLGRVLAGKVGGIAGKVTRRLVKWDGDGPIPDDAHLNPHLYPQVAEVIGEDNVIYRRS